MTAIYECDFPIWPQFSLLNCSDPPLGIVSAFQCPAIQELKSSLSAALPSVTLETIVKVDPGTRHTSGVAMDIMLDMREPREYEIAKPVIQTVTDQSMYFSMTGNANRGYNLSAKKK